jgi:hypothetical protein
VTPTEEMEVKKFLKTDSTESLRKTARRVTRPWPRPPTTSQDRLPCFQDIPVQKMTKKHRRTRFDFTPKQLDDRNGNSVTIFTDEVTIVTSPRMDGVWRIRGQTGVGTYPKVHNAMCSWFAGP